MKILITTLILMISLSLNFAVAEQHLNISQKQISDLKVEVQNPTQVSSVWSKNLPGHIVIPNAQIRVLSPMLSGLVNILYVAEGDQITWGQKLAEISSPAFLKAQQNYLQALAKQALMKRNHDRNQELLAEGIISERNFMSGAADYQAAEAFLYGSYQSLLFSGMSESQIEQLKTSRKMVKTMVITAPFDGVVLKQTATTGQHVNETEALYHIGKLNPLWVEIHVPYTLRPSLRIGNAIRFADTDMVSEIITIGQMIHEEDQGIMVRGVIDAPQSNYIPGQFVKVKLEQFIEEGSFYRIPLGAIIRDGNDVTLFVRDNNGFLLKKARIIADEGNALVVAASIKATDQIAVKGIATLKGILEGLGDAE